MNDVALHVPHPPARPGDRPDFSYLSLSPAGAVARPQVEARARDIESLGKELVRVLDEHGEAIGPWDPKLDSSVLVTALRHMLLTRAMDDRLQRAQRQGKISFYIQSTGEEAAAVGPALALRPGDMLFPSYRTQALQIARGRSPVDLMCQCLSNTRDMCKGRQLPVMYHWREGNIFSVSGNLATQLPQAVGWAMASAIKGETHLAATWTGEGATAEADFHHAMTFAAVFRAPVLLNVVNNQWAISSFQGVAGGEQASFAARGAGYGIAGVRVDGNDLLATYAVTQWAAERARRGIGATLIEFVTYRAGAHSTSDDTTRYRPKDEWRAFPLGCPVARLQQHLVRSGAWSDEQHAALLAECTAQIEAAWREALAAGSLTEGPRLDPLTMFDDVLKHPSAQLERQRRELASLKSKG